MRCITYAGKRSVVSSPVWQKEMMMASECCLFKQSFPVTIIKLKLRADCLSVTFQHCWNSSSSVCIDNKSQNSIFSSSTHSLDLNNITHIQYVSGSTQNGLESSWHKMPVKYISRQLHPYCHHCLLRNPLRCQSKTWCSLSPETQHTNSALKNSLLGALPSC